jgi:hypothetical protein
MRRADWGIAARRRDIRIENARMAVSMVPHCAAHDGVAMLPVPANGHP